MAIPGTKVSQGASKINRFPSDKIFPQVAWGGGTPNPRKLRPASVKIAVAIPMVAETKTGVGRRQQNLTACLDVRGVLHHPYEILRDHFSCTGGPDVADRIGALVSGPQLGMLRGRTLKMSNICPELSQTFSVTRLGRLFDIAQRRAERLALRQRKGVLRSDDWLDEYLGFAGSER